MKTTDFVLSLLSQGGGQSGGGSQTQLTVLPFVDSATLINSLQADRLALSDSDPVSAWADLSGNGNDFTTITEATPTKLTDGDGYSYVEWNGSGQVISGGNIENNLPSMAIFLVCQVDESDSGTINYKMLNPNSHNNAGWSIRLRSGGAADVTFADEEQNDALEVTSAAGWDASVKAIWTVEVFNRSEIHLYYNGSKVGEEYNNYGTLLDYSSSENVVLGYDAVGSTFNLWSRLSYQINDLDNWSADRAAIVAWLADKKGVTL